ncbi:MAG TPA: hypothetical protein VJ921_11010 [Vicinamibacteria bacterium]|nr:hypothetical protein [Vicinamibacteria bacterium]
MAGIPDEEAPARTTIGVARDVVLSLTGMVEDSAELVSATVREELIRFRVELARGALSGVAIVVGGALLTAGVLIYLREILRSWPLTLVLAGVFYLGVAAVFQMRSK